MVTLHQINTELESLGLPSCNSLPSISLLNNTLKNQRVLLIDDSAGVFEIYIPALMLLTDGKASFIHHQAGMQVEDILDKIEQIDPTVILVDYYLAENLVGSSLCAKIKEKFSNIVLVGFSTIGDVPKIINAFEASGAIASIKKTQDSQSTLFELAERLI
ncbi:MAG: hypothetical protein KDD56_04600 [Bdellovibrionales bacterium]|nr:hypothetical protein [Bdellovibrionales bacterium]